MNKRYFYIYKMDMLGSPSVTYFTEKRTFTPELTGRRLFVSEKEAEREADRLGPMCAVEEFYVARLI